MSWRRVNQQKHWNVAEETAMQRSTGPPMRPSKVIQTRDPRCKWCRYRRSEHNELGYRLLTREEQEHAVGAARNSNPHVFAV